MIKVTQGSTIVFLSEHNDYPEFEVDDGLNKTCWTRQISEVINKFLPYQQNDPYKVGKLVKIIYVNQKFKKVIPGLGEENKCVLEIWVRGPLFIT